MWCGISSTTHKMQREVHVLMLNNEFPPLGGGAGVVNRRLLQACADVPWLHIDLITSSASHAHTEFIGPRIAVHYEKIRKKNIHHFTLSEFLQYCLLAYKSAAVLLKRGQYDLLFAWNAVPVGGLAFLLSKRFHVPYAMRMAGPDIPGWEKRYAFLHLLIRPFLLLILRHAAVVVTKCMRERDAISPLAGMTPVQVIHNGVELPPKQVRTPACPDIRLIGVGRLIALKGQADMIHAVRLLRDKGIPVTLTLVGEGDEAPMYRGLVDTLGVGQCVCLAGQVPHEQVGDYYRNADICLFNSENEGMSNAMLEAMAYGLPVVTTAVGGTEELLKDGQNGFVFRRGDIVQLCACIEKFANDRLLLERMALAARRTAEQFSAKACNEKYITLFAGRQP